uniref:Uncharacterized protein n=1 Tax=Anguilla anguilla TaxID=7936 RepID=A0A0E9TVY9_ANGAN
MYLLNISFQKPWALMWSFEPLCCCNSLQLFRESFPVDFVTRLWGFAYIQPQEH